MISATQLRKGHIIRYRNDLHMVLDLVHYTPGNKRGFFRTKLRNLRTGATIEEKLMSDESFEQPFVESRDAEYSYSDTHHYVFMDPKTYEQIFVPREKVDEEAGKWLKEGMLCTLQMVEGEPMSIELPPRVEVRVRETEPQLRGATQANSYKPATLENGVKITVPPFIQSGEVILVNPREGKYLGRRGE